MESDRPRRLTPQPAGKFGNQPTEETYIPWFWAAVLHGGKLQIHPETDEEYYNRASLVIHEALDYSLNLNALAEQIFYRGDEIGVKYEDFVKIAKEFSFANFSYNPPTESPKKVSFEIEMTDSSQSNNITSWADASPPYNDEAVGSSLPQKADATPPYNDVVVESLLSQNNDTSEDNESDFIAPKKFCRRPSPVRPKTITTENSFGILSQEEQQAREENSKASTPVSPKIRPIVIINAKNHANFTTSLGAGDKFNFKAKSFYKDLKIFPETLTDRVKIMEFLKKEKIGFYVVPDANKNFSVVIRGLNVDTDTDSIKEKLLFRNFDIIDVTQLKSFRSKEPLPLFKITLPKNPKNKEIFQLKDLFKIIIYVEAYRPKKRIIQCFNFNGFNHYAKFCHAPPRCFRCNGNHDHRTCPSKLTENFKPTCCNCSGDHVAPFRGCPNFPKIKPSYAKMTAKNIPEKTVPQDSETLFSLINEIKEELKINSFAELKFKLKNTLRNMKKLSEVEDKMLCFLDLFKN